MNLTVQENPSYVRDSNSKAVINVDSEAYAIAYNRKKKLHEQQNKIVELQSQLDSLIEWKNQVMQMLDEKNNK